MPRVIERRPARDVAARCDRRRSACRCAAATCEMPVSLQTTSVARRRRARRARRAMVRPARSIARGAASRASTASASARFAGAAGDGDLPAVRRRARRRLRRSARPASAATATARRVDARGRAPRVDAVPRTSARAFARSARVERELETRSLARGSRAHRISARSARISGRSSGQDEQRRRRGTPRRRLHEARVSRARRTPRRARSRSPPLPCSWIARSKRRARTAAKKRGQTRRRRRLLGKADGAGKHDEVVDRARAASARRTRRPTASRSSAMCACG